MRVLKVREKEILRMVVKGHKDNQIAAALYLSPHTVRWYLRSAVKKLNAHSRAHAAVIFSQSRWMTEG